MKKRPGEIVLIVITYLICSLILLPILLVVAVSFTKTPYLTFPPQGVTFNWYGVALANSRLIRSLAVSVRVGIFSAVASTGLGIIAGLFLSRSRGWLSRVLTPLFLAPLTIPIIVLAIGLLFFLTSMGLVRSIIGLVLGHTVITFPYAVRMVSASVGRQVDQWERAASVLGANPWQVFLRVTFPSIRAGVIGGMMFSFMISFNNVTIALFVSGARTQTLPVVMFQLTKESVSPELAALASMLIVATFVIMILLERWFGIYRVLEQRQAA